MATAELTFTHDTAPGVSRRRAGRGFAYYDTQGHRIVDRAQVERVRKQYRYHTRWREERDEEKFGRLGDCGKVLPTIRKTVAEELATLVRGCQSLPGQTLFQWTDDNGDLQPIASQDVTDYLRETTDGPFTAKDFRTWGASSCVLGQLAAAEVPDGARAQRIVINQAIDYAASLLGNSRSVCRNSYVHPAIVAAYSDGRLARMRPARRASVDLLAPEECLLLDVL